MQTVRTQIHVHKKRYEKNDLLSWQTHCYISCRAETIMLL